MGMIQIYNNDGYSTEKQATAMATFRDWDDEASNFSCYGSLTFRKNSHTVTFSGAPLEILPKECVEHYIKELNQFFPTPVIRIFEEHEVDSQEALAYLKAKFRGDAKSNKNTLFVTSQIDNEKFFSFFGNMEERARVMRLMYHTFLRAFHTYSWQLQKAWIQYRKDDSKSLMTWYMWFAATDRAAYSEVYMATEVQGSGHSFRHPDTNAKVPISARQLIANCYLRMTGVNSSFTSSACINVPKTVTSK